MRISTLQVVKNIEWETSIFYKITPYPSMKSLCSLEDKTFTETVRRVYKKFEDASEEASYDMEN